MMLSIHGCIKSVKIYKNFEKLYNKKRLAVCDKKNWPFDQ